MVSEIVIDLLLSSCYQLFLGHGIKKYQILSPDPFVPGAREGLSHFAGRARKYARRSELLTGLKNLG